MSAPVLSREDEHRTAVAGALRRLHQAPTPAGQRAARATVDRLICPRCLTPRVPRDQACHCPRDPVQ